MSIRRMTGGPHGLFVAHAPWACEPRSLDNNVHTNPTEESLDNDMANGNIKSASIHILRMMTDWPNAEDYLWVVRIADEIVRHQVEANEWEDAREATEPAVQAEDGHTLVPDCLVCQLHSTKPCRFPPSLNT